MVRLGPVLLAAALVVAACANSNADSPAAVRTIAFLRAVPGAPSTEPSFMDELRQAGFIRGQNLRILAGDADVAYPDPQDARIAAAQWQSQGVDLILALSTTGARAAREGAPETNVLFISNEPVASGLVTDERTPEGRLTGVTFRVPADRTLHTAQRVLPHLHVLGLPYPSDDPAAVANRDVLAAAAERLGISLLPVAFVDADGLRAAVGEVAARGADALVISTSPAATRLLEETRQAAAAHRLPVIANTTLAHFALVSLAPDTDELGRQLARQAARLLSGTSPVAVPVEDPRSFTLIINAAVAAQLGIEVPTDVIREAQKVAQ